LYHVVCVHYARKSASLSDLFYRMYSNLPLDERMERTTLASYARKRARDRDEINYKTHMLIAYCFFVSQIDCAVRSIRAFTKRPEIHAEIVQSVPRAPPQCARAGRCGVRLPYTRHVNKIR
jgi:hypothetical protein